MFSIVTGPDKVKYDDDRMLKSFGDTEDDYQRLHVEFDWDSSLVELLTREKTTYEKGKLKDLIHIVPKGKVYNCLSRGLRDVSAAELGANIHADEELCKGIQDVIGIQRHRIFSPKA